MALSTFETASATSMRRSMGRLSAGVSVVTADDAEHNACGMTISSMTSISLEPPVLMVSLTHGSRTTDAVEASGRFAVSILGARQEAIARRFATRGGARFDGLECDHGTTGLPMIKDALAQFECRVHSAHDIGDHRVFYGSVQVLRYREGTGLVFYSGRFGNFRDFGHDEVPWLF